MNKKSVVNVFTEDKITVFVFSWVIFFLLLFYLPLNSYAQDQDMYKIETIDRNVFIGILIEEDDKKILIRSEVLGELTIERTNIKKMTKIDPNRIRGGVYWFENPHATRYFFSTNAIGLKKNKDITKIPGSSSTM